MEINTIYDSFARLMFSIAMVDGTVEKEEREVLKKHLGDHPVWPYITKYFDHPQTDVYSIVESYKELVEACKEVGFLEDYKVFISTMEHLERVGGEDDENLVKSFLESLKERLLNQD